MKKILLLTIVLSFVFVQKNFAQNVQIVGATFAPTTPLSCQDLIFDVNHRTFCSNFVLDSIGHSYSGTSLNIGFYYTASPICAGIISDLNTLVNVGMIPGNVYNVTIEAFLNLNSASAHTMTTTVTACCPFIASYSSDLNQGCTADGAPINLSNTSVGATTSEWKVNGVSFGNSNSIVLPTNVAGSFDVKLISSDGSCVDSTSQTFNVYNSPALNLGADINGCTGETININATAGFNTYTWTNNASTTATAPITSSNTYKLTVEDSNGCTATDSVIATFTTSPSISLGNDTTICSADILTLDAGVFTSYLWNTGATTQSLNVSNSQNYSLTVTDANGCSDTDDINVLVNAGPNVNIGADTTAICLGESATLNAGSFGTFVWSTAETSNSIVVNNAGTVSVEVTDMNGCKTIDETYVQVNDLPNVEFGVDTLGFCAGNSVTLNPGAFNNYAWSTNTSSQTINVSTAGNYSVEVTDSKACKNTASVYVKQNANPIVNLGENVDLCITDKLELNAGTFATYLWNDGSTLANLEINGADFAEGNNTISLSVTDQNGCIGTDQIVVKVKNCVTSISSIALENKISVYPNPAKNVLNIQVAENVKSDIKVYNVLGKVVVDLDSKNLNTNSSIDISKLNEGIYFIEISIDNERLVKQFVKIK